MMRAISLLLVLCFLAFPVSAAGIINPSTESQSYWCRFYYTKWICELGSTPGGSQGSPGSPGLGNITNLWNLTGNFSAYGETNFFNYTSIFSEMNQTPNMTAGPAGSAGIQGDQGIQGIQGSPGEQGIQGVLGINGTQGIQGEKGDQGIPGINGTIPDASQFPFLNGSRTLTGIWNFGGYNLSNLLDPISAQDAATKNYVDIIPIYNASYWTGTNYNSSYLTSTYNSTYDAYTNYNASYWTGTNYNASYLTSTYNATYDAKTTLAAALAAVYPVGSIYISTVVTNPATTFGFGTWVTFGNGRVLVGNNTADADFDTVEETGGSKTNASIVTHTHTTTVYVGTTDGTYGTFDSSSTTPGTSKALTSAAPAGAVGSINIVQPYIVVYFWERTA